MGRSNMANLSRTSWRSPRIKSCHSTQAWASNFWASCRTPMRNWPSIPWARSKLHNTNDFFKQLAQGWQYFTANCTIRVVVISRCEWSGGGEAGIGNSFTKIAWVNFSPQNFKDRATDGKSRKVCSNSHRLSTSKLHSVRNLRTNVVKIMITFDFYTYSTKQVNNTRPSPVKHL